MDRDRRRRSLLARMLKEEPRLRKGKKLTYLFLALWLILFVSYTLLQVYCERLAYLPESKSSYLITAFSILCAWLILTEGSKVMVLLLLAGGAVSVCAGFYQGLYPLLALEMPTVFRSYLICLLAAGWAELLAAAALLFLPPCAEYLLAVSRAAESSKEADEHFHL